MDLKNLITFVHVAELNNFTKAAEKLGFSQSTVSFQIKQLELELQSQLFERVNHTVVLTEKGRKVLKYAHQISKLTQELKETMQDQREISGQVRLAMADSLCESLFRKGFSDFRKQYPGILLKVIAAGTEEMFRLMNHNEVDAILTLDTHIYHAEYVIVREEKTKLHFVAGKNFPLKQGKISISELAEQPFLLTEKGMSYRRMMDEKMAELSLEVKPILELGSTNLICSLVAQGVGISFLPEYVTKRWIKEEKLVYLEVEGFEIEIWKQLLYHRDKWVSPQIESVLQYCVEREF